MIHIGVDIESIQRVQKLLDNKPQILKKFYFDSEWNYSMLKASPAQTLTGIWCAKEAVIKAMSYYHILKIQDIEIERKKSGMPIVILHNFQNIQCFHFSLSISHCKEYAVANVLVNFINI
ncbi:MAG: holo-ACP synthase [Saprospiraceae bacterium]|nr:holo-ACP synthase [Saprospiraceae bacterium]